MNCELYDKEQKICRMSGLHCARPLKADGATRCMEEKTASLFKQLKPRQASSLAATLRRLTAQLVS